MTDEEQIIARFRSDTEAWSAWDIDRIVAQSDGAGGGLGTDAGLPGRRVHLGHRPHYFGGPQRVFLARSHQGLGELLQSAGNQIEVGYWLFGLEQAIAGAFDGPGRVPMRLAIEPSSDCFRICELSIRQYVIQKEPQRLMNLS